MKHNWYLIKENIRQLVYERAQFGEISVDLIGMLESVISKELFQVVRISHLETYVIVNKYLTKRFDVMKDWIYKAPEHILIAARLKGEI